MFSIKKRLEIEAFVGDDGLFFEQVVDLVLFGRRCFSGLCTRLRQGLDFGRGFLGHFDDHFVHIDLFFFVEEGCD